MCGHEERLLSDVEGEGDEDVDLREWKPELCFVATDVEYGGKVVDLTRNITRGPLERIPGAEKMWRVPHYVKVRTRDGVGSYIFQAVRAFLCGKLSQMSCRRNCPGHWLRVHSGYLELIVVHPRPRFLPSTPP